MVLMLPKQPKPKWPSSSQKRKSCLVLDNRDSFTYNVVHWLEGWEVEVLENDDERILEAPCDLLVIGPGPGNPTGAGLTMEALQRRLGEVPILGICLGHQAIAQFFGGRVVRAKRIVHGKTSEIFHNGPSFAATRYHSLIVERESLPDCLEISAETAEGEIMGIRHRDLPIEGVQFHPESILTSPSRERRTGCSGSVLPSPAFL